MDEFKRVLVEDSHGGIPSILLDQDRPAAFWLKSRHGEGAAPITGALMGEHETEISDDGVSGTVHDTAPHGRGRIAVVQDPVRLQAPRIISEGGSITNKEKPPERGASKVMSIMPASCGWDQVMAGFASVGREFYTARVPLPSG